MDNQPQRYIVESVTKAGARFRPSDWIDRISSWDATFSQHRLVYSQRMHPIMLDGQKMLAIEPELKNANRQMFDSVMQFIDRNNLKVYVQYADGHLEDFDGDNEPASPDSPIS
ncbi:MAG: DUF3579 domain-containing protein [Halothiobacillaceae bacterium]|nr:DUF3579 domain-containing protein [Halothiobacillaceae bacterium]HER34063.1 DUF3579 domain-containing protein [Halothiobacillaceae bacterium]